MSMGIKVFKHCLQKLSPLICLNSFCDANDQLIEINRIAAKVDGSIVTWGEIERSMEQFNFTDTEKKTRAAEFIDGKVDRLLAISAFNNKHGYSDSYIEQEYSKRLISEFNGDRRLSRLSP